MESPGYFCSDCGMNVDAAPLSDAEKAAVARGLSDMDAGRVVECDFSQYAEESNAKVDLAGVPSVDPS
jgi:predicted transcriptional regulator